MIDAGANKDFDDGGLLVYESVWGTPPPSSDPIGFGLVHASNTCYDVDRWPLLGETDWYIISDPSYQYRASIDDDDAFEERLTRLFGDPMQLDRDASEDERAVAELL